MPARPSTRRRTRRPRGRPAGGSDAVVRSILDATLEVLGSHGYAGLRIDDVAARAGVNKTSVYRRWRAKSDLVIAALEALAEHGGPPPDTGSLRGDLLAVMRDAYANMQSRTGVAVARALLVSDDPEIIRIARAVWNRHFATPSPVFERAIARGELPRGTDSSFVRELILAPILHRALLVREPIDNAFFVRVVDAVLRGVLVNDSRGARAKARGRTTTSRAPRSARADGSRNR